MKFLFMAPRFHTNQLDMVRILISHGHQVEFITMGASKSEDHTLVTPHILEVPRIFKIVSGWFNPKNDFARYADITIPNVVQLYRYLLDIKPNITIVRGFLSPYILLALPMLFLSLTKVIVYTQGPKYRSVISWKLRFFYFMAFNIFRLKWFTPVKYKLPETDPIFTNKNIKFIPFFKEINNSALNRLYQINKPRFLSIGKYQQRKNFISLLEAFAAVNKKKSCTLTIIGENSTNEHALYLSNLRHLVKKMHLEKNVTLYENMTYKQVQEQYLNHDIFIIPSYGEPASISQIEAMACGLPVICCVDNGTAHYVADKKNGLHCGKTIEDLRKAMSEIVEHPEYIEEWGRYSIQLLLKEYNIQTGYVNFMGLCKSD